jgi:hypothetical protein
VRREECLDAGQRIERDHPREEIQHEEVCAAGRAKAEQAEEDGPGKHGSQAEQVTHEKEGGAGQEECQKAGDKLRDLFPFPENNQDASCQCAAEVTGAGDQRFSENRGSEGGRGNPARIRVERQVVEPASCKQRRSAVRHFVEPCRDQLERVEGVPAVRVDIGENDIDQEGKEKETVFFVPQRGSRSHHGPSVPHIPLTW